jgi:hypothetical protein
MIGRGAQYRLLKGLGQSDTPYVTSEIILPGDPRYIDMYTDAAVGGGISYPDATSGTNGAAGSSSGSQAQGSQAGGPGGNNSGTGTGPATGSGPFAGGGGGSGWGPGPGIKCTDVLGNSLPAQAVCGTLSNLVWWVLGGVVDFCSWKTGGDRSFE